MTEFAPWNALLGGAMIGLAAVAHMALNGRIAGISGIAAQLLPTYGGSTVLSSLAFVAGLMAAPLIYGVFTGELPTLTMQSSGLMLIAAGLMTGFGAVWGQGCTSGHGVCGLSRLSPRSFIAVLMFIGTAIATVFVLRHVMGGV